MDLVERYERGELTRHQVREFFQYLVQNRLDLVLGGHYRQTAKKLLKQNLIWRK